MADETRELTYGEKAVGLTFNPSADVNVQKVKELYAQIIDLISSNVIISEDITGESAKIVEKAIREAQTAQMWAVKAITWKY